MCGIFGFVIAPNSSINCGSIRESFNRVALYSETRGQDSSGIVLRNSQDRILNLIKGDIPIHQLIKTKVYKKEVSKNLLGLTQGAGFSAFGHSRLVTNGSQLNEENNQPVLKDDIITVHNGIIVNAEAVWEKNTDLKRTFQIDTELIPALLRNEMKITDNLVVACNNAFSRLEGTFSIATMFLDTEELLLATNNGSIYYLTDNKQFFIFASEGSFLDKLKKENCFNSFNNHSEVKQLLPGNGIVIKLNIFEVLHFNFCTKEKTISTNRIAAYKIKKHLIENLINRREAVIDPSIFICRSTELNLFNLLEYNIDQIRKLKLCSKCLLPATFPFIEFDPSGVCNFCNNHSSGKKVKSFDDLKLLIEPYRRRNGKSDCIVPFSGGRDSTYSLHIIKKELGLNPIAFTYDWGMVTDLARRNIARVCGKLGVENIIVSADIHWKRENIRKNVQAWLKSPKLGMIPLFMAGDKYFFYYCNQVKKQTGIDLNIWGVNPLENTEFKTGFAGLPPKFDKKRIYSLSLVNQFKLFGFIGSSIIKNPSYINQSVFDSLGSFAARYIAPKKDYFHLFDYYRWDEDEINLLIKNEYKWETAIDTKSTWRIGDGTASFYNYIYYTVAGFSENDTFRSNQIREGMLTREKAIQLAEEDNIPRYETLRWYLEIIGLDFVNVIKTVNKIPKLYPI